MLKQASQLTALVLVVPSLATAQVPVKTCVTSDEAQALVTYALPQIVRGLAKQCLQSLPATSALIEAGDVMAAGYQVDANKAWPLAQRAFDKLAGFPISKISGEKGIKTLIEIGVVSQLSSKITPSDCPAIDRALSALQPLPAQNVAVVVTALVQLTGKDGKMPLTLCPAGVGRAP